MTSRPRAYFLMCLARAGGGIRTRLDRASLADLSQVIAPDLVLNTHMHVMHRVRSH